MKRFGIVLCSVLLSIGTAFAAPQKDEDLLEVLLGNGTITQEQYQKLKKEPLGNDTQRDDIKVSTNGKLEVSTYDGKFAFELGARFATDMAFYFENKNPLGNGTEIRTARVELEGTVFSDWDYEFSFEFADFDMEVKDAFLTYKGFGGLDLNMGHFKTPFSLEQMGSKQHLTFMERANLNKLVPDRKVGASTKLYGSLWTAEVGFFGDAYDEEVDDEGDEGWTTAGRFTFVPYHSSDSRVFHLGASAAYIVPDDDREVKFKRHPESHLTSVDYLNTGKIKKLNDRFIYGLESAMTYGPFSVQGEFVHTILDTGDSGHHPSFTGAYVFASWMITGESRNYKFEKGAFGRIKPDRTYGALELAARYSYLDLNSSPEVFGGREDNITLAFNWYFNSYIRLMANYIYVNNDGYADDNEDLIGNDDINIIQARLQLSF